MSNLAIISSSHMPQSTHSTTAACCGENLSVVATACQSSASIGNVPGAGIGFRSGAFMQSPKKKSADQDAQRTPATGHTERTLADTPFGARHFKALLLYGHKKVAVFRRSSVLT